MKKFSNIKLSHIKKVIYVTGITLVVFALYIFMTSTPKDQTWESVVANLPRSLNSFVKQDSGGSYMLMQTHAPLVIVATPKQFKSNILKKWYRSADDRDYEFCPDSNLKFKDGTVFSVKFLKNHLVNMNKKLKETNSVKASEECVQVHFTKPKHNYLYFLAAAENAPNVKYNKKWGYGLGDFDVVSYEDTKVTMERREKVRDGYNKVIFYKAKYLRDTPVSVHEVEDINYTHKKPEYAMKHFNKYVVSAQRTISLLMNMDDIGLRKLVYNCLDIHRFISIYRSNSKEFIDVASVLPTGLIGARGGPPKQNCQPEEKYKGQVIRLLNLRDFTMEPFKEYFKDFEEKTGVKVEMLGLNGKSLVEALYDSRSSYDMVAVSLNATEFSYAEFLKYFTNKEYAIVDHFIESLDARVDNLSAIRSDEKLEKEVSSILDALDKEYLYVPIYQSVQDIYYPKRVKSLKQNSLRLSYPIIGDLKI